MNITAALGLFYGAIYTPLLFGEETPSRTQIAAHLEIALNVIFTAFAGPAL